MAKYIRKPVPMEAIQWFPGVEIPSVFETADGQNGYFADDVSSHFIDPDGLINPGDWCVIGAYGWVEVYTDKQFHELFELADNEI